MDVSKIPSGKWNVYRNKDTEELYLVPNQASSAHCPITALPLTPILNALNNSPLPVIADFSTERNNSRLFLAGNGEKDQKLDLIC